MSTEQKQPANIDEALTARAFFEKHYRAYYDGEIDLEAMLEFAAAFASSIQAEGSQEIDPELSTRAADVSKQIRQHQERGVDFLADDIIRLIQDLLNAYGTEQTMHAAWEKRATGAEQQLAEYTENRQVGTCVDCGASIWFRQERMEDETGMYHPLCRAAKVARAQGMREAAEIALAQRCERDTPWDLACTTIAAAIERAQSHKAGTKEPCICEDEGDYMGCERNCSRKKEKL